MEQLFNKFSDIKALEAEKVRILGLFREIKTGIMELSSLGVKIESSKSVKEAAATIKLYQAEVKKLEAAQKQYHITEQKIIDLKIKESKAAEMAARATAAEAKVTNEITKGKILETKERLANAAAAEKETAATTKSYGNRAANAKLAQRPVGDVPFTMNVGDNGKDIENLKKTGVVVTELDRAQAQAANSANALNIAKQKITKTTEVEGRQLKGLTVARLAGAKTEAEALENNKQLLAMRKQVDISTENGQKKVLLINEAIDQNNRLIKSNSSQLEVQKKNVGNYAAGVETGTNKILKATRSGFGALRRLAFILPGLGIAGIFNILFEGLSNLTAAIFKTDKALNKLKATQDTLNTAFGDDGYKEAVRNVDELTISIDLAKKGFLNKKDVLEKYNETLGLSIGKAKDLDEAEQFLVKNGEAYIKVTLLKAAANLALTQAAQLAVDLAKDEQDPNSRDLAITLRRTDAEAKFGKQIRSTTEYTQLLRDETDAYNATLSNRTKETLDAYDKIKGKSEAFYEEQLNFLSGGKKAKNKKILEDIAKDFIKQYGTLAAQFAIDLTPDKDKEGAKGKGRNANSDLFKNEDEKRKVLFEVRKKIIEDNMEADRQIFENENENYFKRLSALRDYTDQAKLLASDQNTFELDELKAQQSEEERIAITEIKGKKEREAVLLSIQSEYKAKRLLVDTNYKSALKKLDTEEITRQVKFDSSVKKIVADSVKEKIRIENELEEHRKSVHETNLQDIQNQYDEDLVLLTEKFNRGEIKEKEYNKKRLRLQHALQIALLEEDIKYTKQTLELAELRAKASGIQKDIDAVAAAKAKLTGLEINLATIVADFFKKKTEETADDFATMFEKIAQVAESVFAIASGFAGAFYDKQKNAIQDQIDLLDEQEQREIEIAEQSILNEQDKAAKIDTIHRLAEARKQVLELKQRRVDQERAKFEKAAGIASIVLNTAVAVTKFLSKGDVIEAIAAGVIGAAQLAVAIATPIPRFAKGKDKSNTYEGKALVAEEGREFRVDSDGKMRLYEKPAIIDIGRNDQILTNQVTESMLRSATTSRFAVATVKDVRDERLDKVVDLLSDIKKKTGVTLYNEHGIETTAWFNNHIRN